ncbi:DUF4158 domain-containing protein [Streptomyces sp. NPDC057521]|uniref:DUF4158 domain-containing protein n=1 Tax=Streptomyces sp. NPDC057521 TaxID=3346156 RepID=UPI003673F7CA
MFVCSASFPLRPVRHGTLTRELEQFFRLDTRALELVRAKRRSATRLGWAVQWGTVRMLGTFLTEDPMAVPASVVRFVAEQLGLDDEHFAEYGTRAQTVYEHAREIRDTYGYRDFAAGEAELREFLVARVWSSLEGPRALFDRAVVWQVNNRVLLPGVTSLARTVAALRQEGNDRLHAALYEVVPYELRTEMVRLLEVPEKKRVSELERLRLGPMRVSGKAMELALDRAREVRGPGGWRGGRRTGSGRADDRARPVRADLEGADVEAAGGYAADCDAAGDRAASGDRDGG